MHVGARRLGSVGLPALYWNFIPLPTGAASRNKGSATVGASWYLLVVLSSKFWAFWGCYGGRGADWRFLWVAVGWRGGAA